MVQESPCAPGTVAVHTQIAASIGFDVYNFCVFAADVDQGGHFGIFFLDEFGGRNDFLLKRKLEFFCQAHADRTGNFQLQAGSSDLGAQGLQFFPENGRHIGLVASVPGKNDFLILVQDNNFRCRGPDV